MEASKNHESKRSDSIAWLVNEAIKGRIFTGASILIARGKNVLYRGLFGKANSLKDFISEDHLFDLASLTKPIVTTSLYLHAIDEKALSPYTKIKEILPISWSGNFRDVEILDLLSHRSGLPAHREFYKDFILVPPHRRKDTLIQNILKLSKSNNKEAIYSDLGYIILGYLIEKIYNYQLDKLFETLSSFWQTNRHGKLTFIGFRLPKVPYLKPEPKLIWKNTAKFVFTSFCKWRNRRLVGEVDDANSFCLGGVAGHAGLFGTAWGVHQWLSHLWEIYSKKSQGLCSHDILSFFWQKRNDGYSWVAGFDTPSPDSDVVSPYFSSKSIGHYGFTGTSFWMDLTDGFTVIILTNRVYFDTPMTKIKAFRKEIHRIARAEYGK